MAEKLASFMTLTKPEVEEKINMIDKSVSTTLMDVYFERIAVIEKYIEHIRALLNDIHDFSVVLRLDDFAVIKEAREEISIIVDNIETVKAEFDLTGMATLDLEFYHLCDKINYLRLSVSSFPQSDYFKSRF